MAEEISNVIRAFILENFESAAQVEVVCILATSTKKQWTVEELSRELRSNPNAIDRQITLLVKNGIVSRDSSGTFTYQPRSDVIGKQVRRFLEFYKSHKFSVLDIIYNRTNEKVLNLADAFLIKKKDE